MRCVFLFLHNLCAVPSLRGWTLCWSCIWTHVIGWSVTAFCSLCPSDVKCGDDHWSLFVTATLVIRAILDWLTIVCCLFLRHCFKFSCLRYLDFLLLVIEVVVLCTFCDSVLSFCMCPILNKKGVVLSRCPAGRPSSSVPHKALHWNCYEKHIWFEKTL